MNSVVPEKHLQTETLILTHHLLQIAQCVTSIGSFGNTRFSIARMGSLCQMASFLATPTARKRGWVYSPFSTIKVRYEWILIWLMVPSLGSFFQFSCNFEAMGPPATSRRRQTLRWHHRNRCRLRFRWRQRGQGSRSVSWIPTWDPTLFLLYTNTLCEWQLLLVVAGILMYLLRYAAFEKFELSWTNVSLHTYLTVCDRYTNYDLSCIIAKRH